MKLALKLFPFLILIPLLIFLHPRLANSVPSKNVKDVLSSSQFSYYGGVASGNVAGNSFVLVDTSSTFPSKTSNNLFVGDTLSIGVGASQSLYIVKDIGATNTIFLDRPLTATSALAGNPIVVPHYAIHTVSFEPQTNATAGIWQVLIKATSASGEQPSDSIPDQGGFDSGPLSPSNVTCPWGAAASIGTTSLNGSAYHLIQCTLAAGTTNPVSTGVTGAIIIGTTTNSLINPSPSHLAVNEGSADIFDFTLRHLDSTLNILEQTSGKIAIVESVRVTATIDPTISFYIDNVGVTDVTSTACGVGTTLSSGAANTTGDRVVFGSLQLNAFNQLAQRLSCVTNATGGYVVTAYEEAPMKNISTGVTIADTACNAAGCTPTIATAWAAPSTSLSEFGYTVTSLGASIPFIEGNFKPFGIGFTNAQTIMLNPAVPTVTERANVCYRITATTTQPAGDYEAKVVYTATATF